MAESITPKGEQVRSAVKWISEQCREKKDIPAPRWVEEAASRFNLSPKEEAFLREFYQGV